MTLPTVGTKFHVLSALSFPLTAHQQVAASRGQTYEVTQELLDANVDRRGNSWLDMIDDPEAQIEKWGHLKFAAGECPPEVEWWNLEGDEASRSLARNLAREAVISDIHDPALKAQRLEEINEKYGRPLTSQSIPYLS